MKNKNLKLIFFAAAFTISGLMACKGKQTKTDTPDTNITQPADSAVTPTTTTMSPAVTADDELKKGVIDATKDYPDLKADVSDGVIMLSGSIKRNDWQKLNPTLNSLHPKKINSTQLTIK